MADLTETATFDAGVYQIETSDPVSGGPSGINNKAAKNLANRTKYLKGRVDAIEDGSFIPPSVLTARAPGTVFFFAGQTPPAYSLACAGQAVSRTTYAALFAAIGVLYGVGNGTTTFNLPDLRAEFIRGWDNGRGVDSGRVLGSAQGHQMQNHTHTVTHASVSGVSAGLTVAGGSPDADASTTTSAQGGTSNSAETRPRNIALLACIYF